MKRSRFSEEQIIAMLKEQDAGVATFYKWKAKYGGLEVSDARRLRALEDENAKLKVRRTLAEQMLNNAMLRDVTAKSGDGVPSSAIGPRTMARAKRSVVAHLEEAHGGARSERKANGPGDRSERRRRARQRASTAPVSSIAAFGSTMPRPEKR